MSNTSEIVGGHLTFGPNNIGKLADSIVAFEHTDDASGWGRGDLLRAGGLINAVVRTAIESQGLTVSAFGGPLDGVPSDAGGFSIWFALRGRNPRTSEAIASIRSVVATILPQVLPSGYVEDYGGFNITHPVIHVPTAPDLWLPSCLEAPDTSAR